MSWSSVHRVLYHMALKIFLNPLQEIRSNFTPIGTAADAYFMFRSCLTPQAIYIEYKTRYSTHWQWCSWPDTGWWGSSSTSTANAAIHVWTSALYLRNRFLHLEASMTGINSDSSIYVWQITTRNPEVDVSVVVYTWGLSFSGNNSRSLATKTKLNCLLLDQGTLGVSTVLHAYLPRKRKLQSLVPLMSLIHEVLNTPVGPRAFQRHPTPVPRLTHLLRYLRGAIY